MPNETPGALLQLALGEAGAGGDLAAEPVGEALPELSGVVVEQHGAGVVVGGRVEGGAEASGRRPRGGCRSGSAPRSGRLWTGPKEGAVRVAKTRGWSRTVAGMSLAVVSGQAGADQVVGVARVGPGAGRAAGGAAVAAGDAEPAAGLVLGGVVVQGLAGGLVLGERPAGEVDGVGAAAGAADLFLPAVEVGGRSHPQQVAEGGRVEQGVRHGRPPGTGRGGRCRCRGRPGSRGDGPQVAARSRPPVVMAAEA